MRCPLKGSDGAETIVGYVAGGLRLEEASVFERHLRACALCREAVSAQEAVWRALDAWQPVPVSPEFDRKLFHRIAAEEHGRWWASLRSPRWLWRPAIPLAAACALIAGVFFARQPASNTVAQSYVQPKLKVEQVTHALDDMDLLGQFAVGPASEQPEPSKKI